MVATTVELNEAIAEFIHLLQQGLRIEAVILFGSYASKTPHEDSDVDLAVISPDFEGLPINKRQERIADLTVDRPDGLSPIGYPSSEYHNPGPHSFLREIILTGRVVYPRSEG